MTTHSASDAHHSDGTGQMTDPSGFIGPDDWILVTGAGGFIGSKVVETLIGRGFRHIRCLVRPSGRLDAIERLKRAAPEGTEIEIFKGNLLSREDCGNATNGVSLIFHLAASLQKSFAGSVLNNVVTTRNLLDGAVAAGTVKRFVNVSSFAVYSNRDLKHNAVLDETCPVEHEFGERYDSYVYAKVKQEEIVERYHREQGLPFVTVRPGVVYGPGHISLSSRIGVNTFGVFFHLGGSNKIPVTYVDNCAEAIVLAGTTQEVDGRVFNIVDDDLPTSRQLLNRHKKNFGSFRSLYIPYPVFFAFCCLWEKYCYWSHFQLPPVFNRRQCSANWKGNRYSNDRIKTELGWKPRVPYSEASEKYFNSRKETRGDKK